MDSPPVGSIQIFACSIFSATRASLSRSLSRNEWFQNDDSETCASVQSSRRAICCSVISKLKNATARGLVGCSATLRITFKPSVVLPMEGRAASTNISPFFKPPVKSSTAAKPVGMPTSTSLFMMLISELTSLETSSWMLNTVCDASSWRTE